MIDGEKKKMLTVGKKTGPAMRAMQALVELRGPLGVSLMGMNLPQSVSIVRRIDDRVIGPHAPPRGLSATASMEVGPPETGTLFNLLSAKHAMDFPSGDQNGNDAPFVPVSFLGALESRD
jgi:hypothetical protein